MCNSPQQANAHLRIEEMSRSAVNVVEVIHTFSIYRGHRHALAALTPPLEWPGSMPNRRFQRAAVLGLGTHENVD